MNIVSDVNCSSFFLRHQYTFCYPSTVHAEDNIGVLHCSISVLPLYRTHGSLYDTYNLAVILIVYQVYA